MELINKVNIQLNLDTVSQKIRDNVRATINKLTQQLASRIKADKLTGQVLKVQTGRLRNSIHGTVKEDGNKFTGIVSTNVEYAPPHEFGFKGSVNVRAHVRNIKQAFGRAIEPKDVNIRSFARNVSMPERSFMRSALTEMKEMIINELQKSIKEIR